MTGPKENQSSHTNDTYEVFDHRVYRFEFFNEFYSWFLGLIHACGLEEAGYMHFIGYLNFGYITCI